MAHENYFYYFEDQENMKVCIHSNWMMSLTVYGIYTSTADERFDHLNQMVNKRRLKPYTVVQKTMDIM